MDTQTLRAMLDVTITDETSIVPFFTMVTETYDALEDKDSFAGFTEKLNEQPDFATERELFLRHAEDNGRLDLVRELAELGPEQISAQAQQPLDRSPFIADLRTYSGYWDRTESGWPAFLAAFQAYAEGTHGRVAAEFFERAEAGEDKVALFEEYGVVFDSVPVQAEVTDDDRVGSAAEQFGYLWADFDGTRESWDRSRDWTYGAANDQDPALYAVLYGRFQALEGQPMPDRIAQLNAWGFNLTASGEEDEAASYAAIAGMFDEEAVEASKQSLQEAVHDSAAIADDEAELITEVFDEVVADAPEFAGVRLTKEQADHLVELLAQETAAAG